MQLLPTHLTLYPRKHMCNPAGPADLGFAYGL